MTSSYYRTGVATFVVDIKLSEFDNLTEIMSPERKAYHKEVKVMSVELSNTRTDLSALAKELDIIPALL
jgi:hypothetical protein